MRRAAARIAHIVQAVIHGDEVEALLGNILRCRNLEPHATFMAMAFRMPPRFVDRWRVEIEPDEQALRKGVGHQQGREADPAADIGDFRPLAQLLLDAIERRDPVLDDIVDIAWPKKGPGCAEEAACVIAPAHAGAAAKTFFNLGFSLDHRGDQVEGAGEINGAVAVGENHRLLR
jgi:hypothetical protein